MLGRREQRRDNVLEQSPITRTRRSARMRVKLQRGMGSDAGHAEAGTAVSTLNKNHQRIEPRGLTRAEAKPLLRPRQRHLLPHQIDPLLDTCATCAACGALRNVQAPASRSFRAVFGTGQLDRPRLEPCACTRRKTWSCRSRCPCPSWSKTGKGWGRVRPRWVRRDARSARLCKGR